MEIHHQHHGYLRGHQLLGSSTKLDKRDQDVIDRLSDIAGAPEPGDALPTYLTGYPLPSRTYFVFARTWYDADAPRAGCVLTHSLIVPVDLWSGMTLPSSLRQLHSPFPHADTARLRPLTLTNRVIEPPGATSTSGSSEVVEALFLEQRQPVLWLSEDAEGAVLRIVDALWPSLRSQFAFQTYALKTRLVDDRPFDLMVAPRGARGRFAAWPGRRVEGGSPPRHPWTSRLATAIFETDAPQIASIDPLGLLRADLTGDPAKLRLSLLWSDLESQSRSAPRAALGMLDVLAAAELGADDSERLALPISNRALDAASAPDFGGDASRYIALLLDKLSEVTASTALDAAVAKATARLLANNPLEGSLLLDANAPRSRHFASITRRAASRMLEDERYSRVLAVVFRQLSPPRLRRLLDTAPGLACQMLKVAQDDPIDVGKLAASIELSTRRTKQRLRAELPSQLSRAEDLPILTGLLTEANDEEIAEITRDLARTGALGQSGFMAELLRGGGAHRRAMVRAAILDADIGTVATAILLSQTLSATAEDLSWVLGLPKGFQRKLVEHILDTWTILELRRALPDIPHGLERLLPFLFGAGQSLQAVRLLLDSDVSVRQKVALVMANAGAIAEDDAEEITATLLSTTLPIRDADDLALVGQVLELPEAAIALARIRPQDLAEHFFILDRPSEPLAGLTLQFINGLAPRLRSVFHVAAEDVAIRLSYWRTGELNEDTYELWAAFVGDAIAHEMPEGVNAAAVTLDHAFSNLYRPVSPLVRVSFPVVYGVVSHHKSNRAIDRSFWRFERDKPGKLRRKLADAFYNSRWPPRELALIAEGLGIADKIFEVIHNKWGGEDYLEGLFEDLDPKRSRLERDARKRLRGYVD